MTSNSNMPPGHIRVERSYSGGMVEVSNECPYCGKGTVEGHRADCAWMAAMTARAHMEDELAVLTRFAEYVKNEHPDVAREALAHG